MTQQLTYVLEYKVEHIRSNNKQDEFTLSDYLEWATEKIEGQDNATKQQGKHILLNELDDQLKDTYSLFTEEYEEKVNQHFDCDTENVDVETKDEDKQLQGVFEKDPKDILDIDGLNKRERYDWASEVIAQGFQKQYDAKTLFSDQDRKLYYYNNGYYKESGESKIYEYTRQALEDSYTNRLANRVVDKVRADTFVEQKEFFDVEPGRLCVKNGVVDLENQEFDDHSSDDIHFQRVDVEYDPDAEYDELERFLSDMFKDDDQVRLIQEIFGYCLYRKYFIKKAVIFRGDADNGKSTVLNILTKLLGQENISGVKLQDLGERFRKQRLVHKLANIVGDLPNKELRKMGDFKALTGGDILEYEEKGGDSYPFVNYAKLIYSANELPRVRNPTPAFFSRWIIINFPYTYVQPSEYNEYTEDYIERNDIKKAKNSPVEELFESQSMRGVLNFALDGLRRLLEQGEFSYTRSRQENMVEWVRQSSSFQAFCMDCVEENPDKWITKQELRDAYRKYCKSHDVKREPAQFQKEHLVNEYGTNSDRRRRDGEYVWLGISFKDDYEHPYKSESRGKSVFLPLGKQENVVEQEASEETLEVSFDNGDKIYAEDYDYDFENSNLVKEGAVMNTGKGEFEVLQADVVEEVLL